MSMELGIISPLLRTLKNFMISSYQKQRAKSKLLEDPKNPKRKSPGMMRVVKSLRFPNIRKRKSSMVSLRNIIRTNQTENMMMTDLCISLKKFVLLIVQVKLSSWFV